MTPDTRMSGARQALAGLALVSLLAFLALKTIVVEDGLLRVDEQVAAVAQGQHNHALRVGMRALALLGSGYTPISLTLIASLLLWGRRRRLALQLPCLVSSAALLNTSVKWLVARPRPHGTSYAFPSGHVLLAVVVVFGALTHLLWTSDAQRAWRCVGTGLCLAAVAGVAVSRVVLTAVASGLTGGAAFLLLGLTRAGICP